MKLLSGKKTFRLPVTQAGSLNSKEFELPSDIQTVTGIALSSTRRELVWKRGSVGVRLAGEEIIVDGEGASEYIYGSNHPARTWAYGEMPIGSSDRRMQVRYQDTEVAGAAFSPYTVEFILTYSKRAQ